MTAAQLIRHSIALYKTHFKAFSKIMMVVFVPYVVATIISVGLFIAGVQGNVAQIIRLTMVVLLNLLMLLATMSVVRFMASVLRGETPPTFKQDIHDSADLMRPALWIILLSLLMMLAGFLAFIIPVFLVSVWYIFSVYALAVDGKRGWEALRFSKSLVYGRWWHVLWMLIAPMVVFGILYLFTDGAVDLFMQYVVVDMQAGLLKTMLASFVALASTLVSLLLSPLPTSSLVILYETLKQSPVVAEK